MRIDSRGTSRNFSSKISHVTGCGTSVTDTADRANTHPRRSCDTRQAGSPRAHQDDDTLKCWGRNGDGQLGYGDSTDRTSPEATAVVDLGSGRTAKMVSAGRRYTCAILDDDTLKCWGNNGDGELGYGDTTSRNSPESTAVVDLGSGRTAKTLLAGDGHTCAILDDDTLKCWGNNGNGQLGIGGLTSSNSVDFGSGRTVKTASAGNTHTCAVLSDESTWCWGSNSNGEVGEGSITSAFFLPSEVRFSSSSSTPSPSTGSSGAGEPEPPARPARPARQALAFAPAPRSPRRMPWVLARRTVEARWWPWSSPSRRLCSSCEYKSCEQSVVDDDIPRVRVRRRHAGDINTF